jgi:hypothetical protein
MQIAPGEKRHLRVRVLPPSTLADTPDTLFRFSLNTSAQTLMRPAQRAKGSSENSKANRIETMKRSRGIWTNLFGGSKKNSEENSEK